MSSFSGTARREVGDSDRGQSVTGDDAGEDASLFAFGQLAFFDFAVEIFGDGFDGAVEEALLDVAENDFVTGRARRRGRCRCPWCRNRGLRPF